MQVTPFPRHDDLSLIGRTTPLFEEDVSAHESELRKHISSSRILIIGGAGSVGQAVTKELLNRGPAALHVVDVSENALAELVRDVRSSRATGATDFRLFCVDCGDEEFEALCRTEDPYDYVLYLAALKHVRSEKDPFTLMRMIRVNVLDVMRALELTEHPERRKFFAISTDKAANPINAMGASKAVMEAVLSARALQTTISKVRLANVAFSNGSLPQAFRERIRKGQPIAAPADVRRYFITESEAAHLCMMSMILAATGETFYPKRGPGLVLQTLADVAHRYLGSLGLEPAPCANDEEARRSLEALAAQGKWPIVYPATDTTGEKTEEEFVEVDANLDSERFGGIGVIRSKPLDETGLPSAVQDFVIKIHAFMDQKSWSRADLLEALHTAVPGFRHYETGKFLDQKM